MKYETRLMPKDEARAFIQNMRWFAGYGRITAKPAKHCNRHEYYVVRASKAAWSNWVEKKED